MLDASIVEYGIGNIQSVVNACHRVGGNVEVARTGDELESQNARAIILPGVGAIGAALRLLRERGFEEALRRRVLDTGVPFLGICVGMQILVEKCEEHGEHRGLGWIPGNVGRMAPMDSPLRLPHVGWNTIDRKVDDPVLEDLDDTHFYFVHSCATTCPAEFVTATSEYGAPFVAAVRRGNIRGVQFHPEKSSRAGEQLLSAFFAASAAC